MHQDFPNLEFSHSNADRFIFRDLEAKDAESLLSIYSDKEAMKYRASKNLSTLEDSRSFIAQQRKIQDQSLMLRKGVEWMENNSLIGTVMFKFYTTNPGYCEIGYSIGSGYWNRGFGRAIVERMTEVLHSNETISRVGAWTIQENIASAKILEMNGFKKHKQDKYPSSFLYLKDLG